MTIIFEIFQSVFAYLEVQLSKNINVQIMLSYFLKIILIIKSYLAALNYSNIVARSREMHAKLGVTPTGSGNAWAEGPMGNVGALAGFDSIQKGGGATESSGLDVCIENKCDMFIFSRTEHLQQKIKKAYDETCFRE